MIEKKINPITPSQRQTFLLKKHNLTRIFKIKSLTKGFQKANGRNNQGKITVRSRGGGHKRLYRIISFNRSKNLEGYVVKILYDPNRSANIAYIKNNSQSYLILAPEGLQIDQYVKSSSNAELKVGNALPLQNIPIGSLIHNISLYPQSRGKLIRSAGTSAQLIQKINNKYAKIRLMFQFYPLLVL